MPWKRAPLWALILPLLATACGSRAPDQPSITRAGRYVLVTVNDRALPAVYYSSANLTLRAHYDTLFFSATDMTYSERALIGQQEGGQPELTSRVTGSAPSFSFTQPSPNTVEIPEFIGGSATGQLTSASLVLTTPAGQRWFYRAG
ncbi:MAG: hypothetical protein M3068_09190 [Gemmatimonadota bacterium]|nr:hypothetical protein [Gemmatimonadota bacterium]